MVVVVSLISASVPNLFNGVSQQPYVQRLTSQGEIQINGYSSLVEGLRKRPPSYHVAKLSSTPLSNVYEHTINRSSTERYTVVFNGSTLLVYDLQGNAKTVTFPNGSAYITDASPSTAFAAVTVADYTFITNKNTTVAMDSSQVTASRNPEALIWIRASNYSCLYTIYCQGFQCWKGTKDSSTAANQQDISTLNIAKDLYTMLTTGSTAGTSNPGLCGLAGSIPTGITFTLVGSTIYAKSNSSTDFSLSSVDGQSDTAISICKGKVSSFSNLPAKAVDGFTVAISGANNDGTNADYYVKYAADSNAPYGGVWKECAKPGEVVGLLASTMPHILVRNADGTFTFKEAAWSQRLVGTFGSVASPNPSFVGRTVNDVFFYQSRLGFLSGENVIMGNTSDTFNFFRQSAIQLLDTDTIDYASTSTSVSTLKSAVPFQGTLLLFSDQNQFQLTYTNILSPKTVQITPATNFVCSLQAKPVGVGPNVYFAIPKGSYTGLREYYLDGSARVTDANDVTAHVPKYMPGTPVKITAASNEECLVMLTSGATSSLYVYRYFWQQNQKMLSSWSVWNFPSTDTVLSANFVVNTLYLVISRSDGLYLEALAVQPGLTDPNAAYECCLDRRVWNYNCGVSYDGTKTTVTLPYAVPDWTQMQCVAWYGDATYKQGKCVTITSVNTTTFTVPGNLTSFIVGRSYTFQYRLSTFTTREPVPMTYTTQAVTEGRLQIRNVLINYANSGYFRVVVTPFDRSPSTYSLTGQQLGVSSTIIGSEGLKTGVFKFPVQCQNIYASIDIINDSHLPCFIQSAGWEGFFVLRSRRM